MADSRMGSRTDAGAEIRPRSALRSRTPHPFRRGRGPNAVPQITVLAVGSAGPLAATALRDPFEPAGHGQTHVRATDAHALRINTGCGLPDDSRVAAPCASTRVRTQCTSFVAPLGRSPYTGEKKQLAVSSLSVSRPPARARLDRGHVRFCHGSTALQRAPHMSGRLVPLGSRTLPCGMSCVVSPASFRTTGSHSGRADRAFQDRSPGPSFSRESVAPTAWTPGSRPRGATLHIPTGPNPPARC